MQTLSLNDTFDNLNSARLLTKTHNISLPALQIQAAKLSTLFAADTKAKFALSDLINATKQDQSIFTSLSHYILQKLIDDQNDDSSFKLFSFKDWSILIMYPVVIPETVFVLYFVYNCDNSVDFGSSNRIAVGSIARVALWRYCQRSIVDTG
jgi:hypothetical protein